MVWHRWIESFKPMGSLMRTSVITVIAALLVDIISMSAAMSETNCKAAANAARAEWRTLSHASSLRPSQRIRTSDGRELAGSQVNYSSVLIARAETACEGGQVEQALSYVDEANKLLHPALQVPVMSAQRAK
jgi:high-affinity K+ transport system ATPase subunit B